MEQDSVMEFPSPPSNHEKTTSSGLLQQRRPSMHLKSVVEIFMKLKESGFDGSIHAALNAHDPRVTFDSKNAIWTTVGIEDGKEAHVPEKSGLVSKLDPDRHKWREDQTPEDPCFENFFKNVDKDQEDFRNAVRIYEEDAKPKYKVGVELSETHSIDDVMTAIEATMKIYNEKAEKGMYAPLRRAFRKIGNYQACQSWIQLAPTQSAYFSLVCGGVMLLLEAASRLRELNDKIIEALAEIPLLVDKSQRLLASCSSSLNMQKYCTDLYVRILHVLGNILQFYREKLFPKAVKVFLRQNMFQQGLELKLTLLRSCANAIEEERKVCTTETGVDTNRTTRETNKVAKVMHENVGVLREEFTALKLELNATTKALTSITRLFMAHPPTSPPTAAPSTPATTPIKVTPSPATLLATRKTLLKSLGYQRRVTLADCETNISQIHTFTLADQNRAVWIMQSATLQSWLNATYSTVLLLNGNMSYSRTLRTPMSFVSAKLADALNQSMSPMLINLHFFCGEHDNWRENLDNGPAAVWNSLLAQLLLQYDDFGPAELRQLRRLEKSDVEALGFAFGRLLKRLPGGCLVFCIVDSVALYDDERRDEAEVLVEMLIELVRFSAAREGCVFKVLLTAATRLRLDATDCLDEDDEVLQVPERFPAGDGFSDLKWEMGIGRSICDI